MSAAARVRPGNLPTEVTRFIGRDEEVAQVRRLLSASRLVTLTGPGGVGKTRLAHRVGTQVGGAFPDGVWLVEVAELTDPALLAVTVAETFGLRQESVSEGPQTLATFLADKQPLLVLDNCEHLVAACARLADTLLRACPRLHILTTSRQPLWIAAEVTLAVHPLSVPDPQTPLTAATLADYESATLFVDRAAAALPGFALTDANCGTIAALCRMLEGMPLAIELAAARLRALSPEQIVDRLADRYQLLTSGVRDSPPRQRSLRALVDWSWELCTEPERTLWSRLSVFAGGLELDAAEAVCSGGDLDPDMILDLIASLVDKSILLRVEAGPTVRYRLLEVIREYGLARLRDCGDEAEQRRRHCRWYAHLAAWGDAHWVSPGQADLLRRFRQEQANLRAALELAVTEGPPEIALRLAADLQLHWFVRGSLSEGRHWLDRALAMPGPDHGARVKALWVTAWICVVQGDPDRASRLLDEAQHLAHLSSRTDAAYLLLVRGIIHLFTGDPAVALPLFEQALPQFRQSETRSGELWALAVLGIAQGMTGRPRDGYADLTRCHDLAAMHGDVWWRTFALWALSLLQWCEGDLPEATTTAKRGLRVGQRVEGEQFAVALSIEVLAWAAGAEDLDERAALLFGAAQRMWSAMRTSLAVFQRLNEFHDESVSRVRSRFGSVAFEAALRRGGELSPDEVFDLALERRPERSVPSAPAAGPLTRRERQVAELMAQGLSNREIATQLLVAQRTAEGHVQNVLGKLGVTSRMQVADWMAEHPDGDAGGG